MEKSLAREMAGVLAADVRVDDNRGTAITSAVLINYSAIITS